MLNYRKELEMIDNFNGSLFGNQDGFTSANYQTPYSAAPTAPTSPVSAQKPSERPDGFIVGWDDIEELGRTQKTVDIKVFGIGGAGNNAVKNMYLDNEKNAELYIINTDLTVLHNSPVKNKICIGAKTTHGHGAGSKPEIGKRAAEESLDIIRDVLEGTDMLYITAGMGGGTGTGASPVIANLARDMGILTIAIVTKPFSFEGPVRMAQAEDGIALLRDCCDAVVIIPNEKLLTLSDNNLSAADAFKAADEVLIKSVQSICRLINENSDINLDFADISTTLRNAGEAHIGVGIAGGENKAIMAAEHAINSPLLETSIKDADGILISIVTSRDTPLNELTEASEIIKKEASQNVNIIFGLKYDDTIGDRIEITVIATKNAGLNQETPFTVPVAAPAPAPYIPSAPAFTAAEEKPAAPIEAPASYPMPSAKPAVSDASQPFCDDAAFKFIQSIATRKPIDDDNQ